MFLGDCESKRERECLMCEMKFEFVMTDVQIFDSFYMHACILYLILLARMEMFIHF